MLDGFNGTAHLIARKAWRNEEGTECTAWLQWDRAFDSAEGRRQRRAGTGKAPGFNGTAHLIARKGTRRSREPLTAGCFNGTAHLIARKGANRGLRLDDQDGFNGTAHLIARKA